jgi:DedD protein
MEVRVRERLIGALVLVAIVVLVVPAILKGREPKPAPAAGQPPTRQVVVPIGGETPPPGEQVLVPEPALPEPESTPKPVAPAAEPRRDERPSPAKSPPPPEPRSAPVEKPAVTKPAPAASSGSATAWAVQLGAFSNRAKAEQLVAELQKRRYAAFMLEYRASGQVLYRVRVGPEQDRARAEEIAARLTKDGFQPVVARHP